MNLKLFGIKIVDFLLLAYFLPVSFFRYSVYIQLGMKFVSYKYYGKENMKFMVWYIKKIACKVWLDMEILGQLSQI